MDQGLGEDVDVSPDAVRRTHGAGEIELIDVREPYERDAGHIAGSRHIAVGDLAAHAHALDPDRPIVFYCRVGGRSAMAAHAFRRAGYRAHSMAGGLVAWDRQGLPLVPEGGRVAEH